MTDSRLTYDRLLALGWVARQSTPRGASRRVTLTLHDRHGNILTECSGEGTTDEAAKTVAANRANAYLWRTGKA